MKNNVSIKITEDFFKVDNNGCKIVIDRWQRKVTVDGFLVKCPKNTLNSLENFLDGINKAKANRRIKVQDMI